MLMKIGQIIFNYLNLNMERFRIVLPLSLRYRLNVVSVGRNGKCILYACKLYEAKQRVRDGVWTYRPVKNVSKAYSDKLAAVNEGMNNCPGIVLDNVREGSVAWRD